jgi:hypothetical protein
LKKARDFEGGLWGSRPETGRKKIAIEVYLSVTACGTGLNQRPKEYPAPAILMKQNTTKMPKRAEIKNANQLDLPDLNGNTADFSRLHGN